MNNSLQMSKNNRNLSSQKSQKEGKPLTSRKNISSNNVYVSCDKVKENIVRGPTYSQQFSNFIKI